MNDIRQFNTVSVHPSRLRVTRGKVLVKRDPTAYKVGSIHIPGTSRYVDRSSTATVLSVGSDVTTLKKGDRVMLGDVMDVLGKVTFDGETYTFLDADKVDLVVEGGK